MSDLADRVEARIRKEWPGEHETELRGKFLIPPIKSGGATDLLVLTMTEIIREELFEEKK